MLEFELNAPPAAPIMPDFITTDDDLKFGGMAGPMEETYEEAKRRIAIKYGAMERLTMRLAEGKMSSLIISGPPGMGKSFTMDRALDLTKRTKFNMKMLKAAEDAARIAKEFGSAAKHEEGGEQEEIEPRVELIPKGEAFALNFDASKYFDKISGGCTAPGLYHALWNMRNGGIVYIDDCDSVFEDLEALNLLKKATDSSKVRCLSWRKRSSWLVDHGIDSDFDFKGQVVFLTNIDFEQVIQRTNRGGIEHFKALIDRSQYLCLTLRTPRDFMIRIRTITEEQGMLELVYGFKPAQTTQLLTFIEDNKSRFYNLSLRLVDHIAQTMIADPENWEEDCIATKMRTGK